MKHLLFRKHNRSRTVGVLAGALAVVCLFAVPVKAQLSDDDIEALRKQGEDEGWTFAVGQNEATKYSLGELCGTVEPENWQAEGNWDPINLRDDLPARFDWRDYGGLTPIRNQGGCGSCWAFSAVGAVESELLIETGQSLDLSEQWLVSCTGAGSCSGGWHYEALRYMRKAGSWKDPCDDNGAVMETDFPYVAWNAPCDCPYDHPYWIDSWAYVGTQWSTPTVEQLKEALYNYGPLSVTVYVNSAFQGYIGGVFNACSNQNVNHAVVLVGWDDNLGPDGVWIMRNSWGTGWGEDGYMKITYGCSKIGYAAVYTNFTPPPPYGLEHSCEEVPISAEAMLDDPTLSHAQTFDLKVVVSENDDWTSTDVTASVDGNLYQHSLFDDSVPQVSMWDMYPSLQFDSFFSARDFAVPGFAWGPDYTNSSMSAIWFDTENTGNGTYTIARFSVTSGTELTLSGTTTARHTGGELHEFSFTMPLDIQSVCVGDLNNDSFRDQADLGIMLSSYGVDAGGDLDGDYDTDQADLGILLSVYGVPCP